MNNEAAFNQLSTEEQQDLLHQRSNYNLDEKIRLLEWDYEHRQLPMSKYKYFAELIEEKIEKGVTDERKFALKRIL